MVINQLPKIVINLKDLDDYTKIKDIFRYHRIQRYLYVIIYKNKIIKIGISHKIQDVADRIYTQIGHMPGWKKQLLRRSNEKTGKAVREMIGKVDPTNFHKDNVVLEIYDFTNYAFRHENCPKTVYAEMQNAEEEAKQDYFNQHSCYPVGNIKQEKVRYIPINLNDFFLDLN